MAERMAPLVRDITVQAMEAASLELAKQNEREARAAEIRQREQNRHEQRLVFGREFLAPVEKDGQVVGHVQASVSGREAVHRILSSIDRKKGDIPFAVDREGHVYTENDELKGRLEQTGLDLQSLTGQPGSEQIAGDWLVATRRDGDSGLRFGIVRPVGPALTGVRRTAAKNFGYGMGLILLALIGVVPLANHLSRDIEQVTMGAERIAEGDLETEVEVRSRGEVGQLAGAFNRMARDLRNQQQRLVDQEVAQERLRVEYERKTSELEEARRFQLSLLPSSSRCIPRSRLRSSCAPRRKSVAITTISISPRKACSRLRQVMRPVTAPERAPWSR